MCTSVTCSTLLRTKSDHHPILLDFVATQNKLVTQFKFQKMWTLHADCKNIVASKWNANIVGCHMFILTKKLQMLKVNLRNWKMFLATSIMLLEKQNKS